MQMKYLQIHKLLSNFAQELVGAFIPLILYKETGNLTLSISYYILQRVVLLIFDMTLRNKYQAKPQLFLLLRIIPMLLYYIFILLINVNVWVACIGILIFSGISDSFKYIPTDTVYNYNSLNSGSNTLGFTKVIERLGVVGAQVMGALFLDNLQTYILIIVSLSIYLISTLPLFISYIKYRGNSAFNVEGISNAQAQFSHNEEKMKKSKVISKKIFILYVISYMLFCMCDLNMSIFGLFLYVKVDKYYIVGILSIIYYAIQIPFNSLVGKIDQKKDLLPYVVISSIASGLFTVVIGLIMATSSFTTTHIIICMALFAVMGTMYPFVTIFYFDRMLLKSKILGKSNEMIVAREFSGTLAQLLSVVPGLGGSFIAIFIVMGVSFMIGGITLPIVEEKTRKYLVNYLQNNQ